KVQPRLLWIRRGESQPPQPIVIVQPQNQNTDRHHHRPPPPPPYWDDYYPYPAPRPTRPPFPIPGLADYLNGNPSIVIINPNNVQNLSLASPATTTAAPATGGRSSFNRRNSNPIVDLLQETILDDDSEVISAADDVEADGVVSIPQQIPQPAHYGAEERNVGEVGEDELALLERQSERGLSPKNLIAFLMQDKRRRRVQEAIAGIYLRNYNLSRK
ncbi:hypothetical protein KR093_004986, partial [Drosophila rubida]